MSSLKQYCNDNGIFTKYDKQKFDTFHDEVSQGMQEDLNKYIDYEFGEFKPLCKPYSKTGVLGGSTVGHTLQKGFKCVVSTYTTGVAYFDFNGTTLSDFTPVNGTYSDKDFKVQGHDTYEPKVVIGKRTDSSNKGIMHVYTMQGNNTAITYSSAADDDYFGTHPHINETKVACLASGIDKVCIYDLDGTNEVLIDTAASTIFMSTDRIYVAIDNSTIKHYALDGTDEQSITVTDNGVITQLVVTTGELIMFIDSSSLLAITDLDGTNAVTFDLDYQYQDHPINLSDGNSLVFHKKYADGLYIVTLSDRVLTSPTGITVFGDASGTDMYGDPVKYVRDSNGNTASTGDYASNVVLANGTYIRSGGSSSITKPLFVFSSYAKISYLRSLTDNSKRIDVDADIFHRDSCYVDTSGNTVTLTLPYPGLLTDGYTVQIHDLKGTFNTNNCTIARNGSKIMGLEEDLVLDVNNSSTELVYIDGDWRIV